MEQPSPNRRLPFDEKITAELTPVLKRLLQEHPEVRSFLCTWDLFGKLNDADCKKALWIGFEEGAINKPDAVMGMLFVLQRVLEQVFLRGVDIGVSLRERIQILATEAARLTNEINRIGMGRTEEEQTQSETA